jgi:undecaprenyl diphosphate synthase
MANSQNKNKNYPKNIGIIMDGNGRWAINNSLNISEGHKKGVSVVKDIVEESVKHGIQSLTCMHLVLKTGKDLKAEINAYKEACH